MSAFAHFERVARRIIEQGLVTDYKGKRHGGHDGFVYMAEGHFSRVYHNVDYPGKVFKISGPSGFGHGSKNFYDRMWTAPGVPCPDVWPTFAEFCMSPEGREAPVLTVWQLERLDHDYCIAEMPYCSEPRRQGVAGSFQREFEAAESRVNMPPDWALALVDIEKRNGFRRDIHSGNVLYDPTKKKDVLSDPWCAVADRSVQPPKEDPDRGLFHKAAVKRINMPFFPVDFEDAGKRAMQRLDEMMLRGIDKAAPAKEGLVNKINWPMLERNAAEQPGNWGEMERVMKQMRDVQMHQFWNGDGQLVGKRADVMIFDDFDGWGMRPKEPPPMPPLQVEERRGAFFDPAPWKAKNKRKMFV